MKMPWRRAHLPRPGDPPTGVSIEALNGDYRLPIEVVYRGENPQGQHVWAAPLAEPFYNDLTCGRASLKVAVMPGRTSITLEVSR